MTQLPLLAFSDAISDLKAKLKKINSEIKDEFKSDARWNEANEQVKQLKAKLKQETDRVNGRITGLLEEADGLKADIKSNLEGYTVAALKSVAEGVEPEITDKEGNKVIATFTARPTKAI